MSAPKNQNSLPLKPYPDSDPYHTSAPQNCPPPGSEVPSAPTRLRLSLPNRVRRTNLGCHLRQRLVPIVDLQPGDSIRDRVSSIRRRATWIHGRAVSIHGRAAWIHDSATSLHGCRHHVLSQRPVLIPVSSYDSAPSEGDEMTVVPPLPRSRPPGC